MQTVGMRIYKVSVGTLDSPGKVRADKQVEDPVHAVGGDPTPLRQRYRLRDVISARRLAEARERNEDAGPHWCPLLTSTLKPGLSGGDQVVTLRLMVMVMRSFGHAFMYGAGRDAASQRSIADPVNTLAGRTQIATYR